MSLLDCTAVELAAKIMAGEVTAVEAMQAVVAQIEKSEAELNCYVTFDKEKALQAAAGADANSFVVTLFTVLFIIALAGIFLTLAVAVGGATINEDVLKELKNKTAIEKNVEVLYEIE